MENDSSAVMSTLVTPIRTQSVLLDPACVKVVFNANGDALYFSRSPIPCAREGIEEKLLVEPPLFYLHVGLYCYRRDFLLKLKSIPVSSYEQTERLEQLRVLENGFRIKTAVIPASIPGIDAQSDYEALVKRRLN